MSGVVVRYIQIPDERIGRHFGHHENFRRRHPGGAWAFSVVQVPIGEVYCLYDDPGVRCPSNPTGLMGSIGASSTGYRGVQIVAMAARLAASLAAGGADLNNLALRRVIELRDGGADFIRDQDEPFALSLLNGLWFVREGIHRTVALVLLGAQFIEAIDFESATIVQRAG